MTSHVQRIIHAIRPEIHFAPGEDKELFGVLDSLDIILIVEELERQLGICVDAEQIIPENFSSLKTLEAFVESLQK